LDRHAGQFPKRPVVYDAPFHTTREGAGKVQRKGVRKGAKERCRDRTKGKV